MPTNEGLSFCSRCDREHSDSMPHDDQFSRETFAKDFGWKTALKRTQEKPYAPKALPRSA